jgi:O-antigen ligase
MKRTQTQSSKNLRSDRDSNNFRFLLLIVILTTLTSFPFTFDAFTTPKLLVLSIGLTFVAILILRARNWVWRLTLPLSLFILVFIASLNVSWVVSGVPLTRGLLGQFGRGNGVLYYVLAIMTLVFSAQLYSHSQGPKLHKGLTFLAWLLSAYALLQRLGFDIATLDTRDLSPVVLTFGNSNFAGSMISVLFAYHVSYIILSKEFKLSHILLLAALLISSSFPAAVQSYLIIAFSVALAISVYLVRTYSFLWIRRTVFLAWILTIIVVALGFFGKTFAAIIFQRQTFQIRIEYWKISLNILRDYLWFGVGPDKFYDYSAAYMAPGSIDLITATRLDNGHNWYLNVGANYGLFALISLASTLLIILVYTIKLMLDKSVKDLWSISAGIAFFGVVLTGIVSIEQPGIGIWQYFFSGIVISAYFERFGCKDSCVSTGLESKKSGRYLSFYTLTILVLVSASTICSLRVSADARLRSAIQKIAVNEGSEQVVNQLFELSLDLKAEPEYLVTSLRYLAQLGMAREVDVISKATFNYNKESIQAALIRADVLKALGRNDEACSLKSQLLDNAPWDYSLLKSTLICRSKGKIFESSKAILSRALPYFQEFSYDSLETSLENRNVIFSLIEKAAVVGRLNFELGNRYQAAKLISYAKEQRIRLELFDNQRSNQTNVFDWGELDTLLNYPSFD